jgi:hypothetical protein
MLLGPFHDTLLSAEIAQTLDGARIELLRRDMFSADHVAQRYCLARSGSGRPGGVLQLTATGLSDSFQLHKSVSIQSYPFVAQVRVHSSLP